MSAVYTRVLRQPDSVPHPAKAQTLPRASVVLAILSVVMQLTVSSNLLYIMGIHYDVPGGDPLVKINPAAYVASLALMIRLCEAGDPFGALVRLFAANRLVATFMIAMVGCMVYAAVSVGVTGTAVYIDSYLSAGILLLVLGDATSAEKRALGMVMLALYFINVVIAIVEDETHRLLIPLYLETVRAVTSKGNFRATALYDHPLNGAMMTSMAMFLLLQMRLRLWLSVVLGGTFIVGLFAFGGRAALVATVLALAGVGLWSLVADLLMRRLTMVRLLGVVGALAVGALITWFVITQTPIADRIVNQDYVDNSAKVRVIEWMIPGMMNIRELLFGVDPGKQLQLAYQVGLVAPYSAIENFWLLAFLNLGLVGFLAYLTGFLSLLADLWRRTPVFGRLMLVVIITVASTSNSLGSKSNILFVLTGALIATAGYAERDPDGAARADALTSLPIMPPPRIIPSPRFSRALQPLRPANRK